MRNSLTIHNAVASIGQGGSGSTSLKYVKYTETTFNFRCKTQYGDKVALVGNINLLGHWDTSKAVMLNTTNDTYPVWTIKIDLPRDKIIEYKFLIVKDLDKGAKPTAKRQILWESLPPSINRIVNTHGKKEIILYEEMDNIESFEEYVEVQCFKRFKSTSEMKDELEEMLAQGIAAKTRTEKRKLLIEEDFVDKGYRESDEEVTNIKY